MEGARLLREGVRQAEVARRLGVRRQSVNEWAKKVRRGGVWALKGGRLGRPRKLHAEQVKRVEKKLERGPQVMRAGKWTVRRVGELIERECRVRYSAAGAWGVLRGMGWRWRDGGWSQVRGQRLEGRGSHPCKERKGESGSEKSGNVPSVPSFSNVHHNGVKWCHEDHQTSPPKRESP
jgi:transposase